MTLSDLKRIVARTPKGVRRIFANDTHITDGHWAYRRDCVIKALPGDFAPEALQRLFGVDAVSILSGLTRVVQSSDHAWSRLPFLTELGDGAAARLYRSKRTGQLAAIDEAFLVPASHDTDTLYSAAYDAGFHNLPSVEESAFVLMPCKPFRVGLEAALREHFGTLFDNTVQDTLQQEAS